MFLGALLDLGAEPEWLAGLAGRLGFEGVSAQAQVVDRSGVRATKVTIALGNGEMELPSLPIRAYAHSNSVATGAATVAHDHGPHRHLGELLAIVERAPVTPWVRERALEAFRLLGEAEAQVHGVDPESVALHEVGAVDAVVDIVGTLEGFERLGLTEVYARPLALGTGWVRAAHGALPVPAPATGILLAGLEVGPNGPVTGEATTPTGAALLRVLSGGPPPDHWRPVSSGWGAGSRDPEGYANVLRILVAEGAAEANEVVTVATDIDDLAPEYVEPIREATLAAGAVDVVVWATQMKKGRPGFRIECVCPAAAVDEVTTALFRHSGTAGVRWWRARRATLARREVRVDAGGGQVVRVKVVSGPDGPRVKPEYDDVMAAARALGIPAHRLAQDLTNRAIGMLGVPGAAAEDEDKE